MAEGRTVGSYRLLSVLGNGASGQVWRAQAANGDEVAVKLLRPDLADNPKIVHGFIDEKSLLERVQGRYVARVRDLIAEGGDLGIVMDLVPGGSVRGLLARVGSLTPEAACDLGGKVAQAVAGLHAAGVIHRDIKPENVLLESAGAPWSPRITDFGIARVIEMGGTSSQRSTALVGTPAYIAPELFEGEHPSAASDVYSVGIMLYELTCGTTPFAHPNPVSVMRGHLDRMPGWPDGIPAELREVIARCIDKSPRQRPSADQVADRLAYLAPTYAGVRALAPLTSPPAGPLVTVADARTTLDPAVAAAGAGAVEAAALDPEATRPVSAPGGARADSRPGSNAASRQGRQGRGKKIAIGVAVLAVLLGGGGTAYAMFGNQHQRTAAAGQSASANPPADPSTTTQSSTSASSSVTDSTPSADSTSATDSSSPGSTTPASVPAAMPKVVGMSLGDATSALGGAQITEIDVPDETATDGTMLGQSPKEGTKNPTQVTLRVARQPVLQYLDEMAAVSGEWASSGSSTMAGTDYPHALSQSIDPYSSGGDTVSYNLGTYYRRFEAMVGQDDNSASSTDTALVEVFGDGRKLWSQTIAFGKPVKLDIEVTKVLRLDIKVNPAQTDGDASIVLGDPRLLGLPGEVPSPSPSS